MWNQIIYSIGPLRLCQIALGLDLTDQFHQSSVGHCTHKKLVLIHAWILQLALFGCLVVWREFQTQEDPMFLRTFGIATLLLLGMPSQSRRVSVLKLLQESPERKWSPRLPNRKQIIIFIDIHIIHVQFIFTHTYTYYILYILYIHIKKKRTHEPKKSSNNPPNKKKEKKTLKKNIPYGWWLKSGDHQLRLVVYLPLFTGVGIHPRWLAGILLSTVSSHDPIPPVAPRDAEPLPSYVLPRSAGAAAPHGPKACTVQRWEVFADNNFLEAKFWSLYMGVSKNRGKTPKMDGENTGKPFLNGWFGGTIIFGNTQAHMIQNIECGSWQWQCASRCDFLVWLLSFDVYNSSGTIITLIHSLPP